MVDIALLPVTDWQQLGERWRELETRADCSFFQSWTWMGCLAEERFPDPVLLQAERDGRVVALALFNRRHGRLAGETLWLSESGGPAFDSVYIEHNSLLRDVTEPESLLDECVRVMRAAPVSRQRQRRRRVVLSGVDGAILAALRSGGHRPWVRRCIAAPCVELGPLRQGGGKYLATLSANSRYQIRRSDRAYEAIGGLVGRCAESNVEAHEYLGALADLHQTTWVARRKPGAFANPFFVRFHRELIDRGLPRGEIELLRITAGEQVVGFLYNYCFRLTVLAYQSGFDYVRGGRHCKPGLTCHHQAIKHAIASGMNRYDFLAGEDRYKRSMANAETVLYWVEDVRVRRCDGMLDRSAIGFGGRLSAVAAVLPIRMTNEAAPRAMFRLNAAMKLALVLVALFGILSATGVRIAVAADLAIINDELDMSNDLVRCAEPTDCTVVMPTEPVNDQTTSARALDLVITEPGVGSPPSDITREGIVALVGDTVGSGMLPSQSVLLPGSVGIGLTTNCRDGRPRTDTGAPSITVAPIGLGVTEVRGGGVIPAPNIRCDRTIAINSVTVDRFGHDAGFVRAMNSVLPINEFPIAGSNPVNMAIQGDAVERSYPFKSGSVRP